MQVFVTDNPPSLFFNTASNMCVQDVVVLNQWLLRATELHHHNPLNILSPVLSFCAHPLHHRVPCTGPMFFPATVECKNHQDFLGRPLPLRDHPHLRPSAHLP
uniref:Uncharacterized protein n=1 Tax=Haptolina brevifila TaxID=156173 RepID=A0A7S2H3Z6_9EUKA